MKVSERQIFALDPAEKELQSLKDKPTTFKWQIELLRILDGQREYKFQHLVHAKSVTEKIISGSSDKAKARITFDRALQRVVNDWRPQELANIDYESRLFDLIDGYTPPNGYQKLMEFLEFALSFPPEAWPPSTASRHSVDLQRKGLLSLSRYFSRIRETPSRKVKNYISILLQNLETPRHSGIAAGLLLQTGRFSVDDPPIGAALIQQPGSLDDILTLFFSSSNRTVIGNQLGRIQLLFHDVVPNGEALFEQAIEKHGATFLDPDKMVIRLHTGEELRLLAGGEIRLNLTTEEALPAYRASTERNSQMGWRKLVKLVFRKN
jgi:hypothetical protein